jgi:hypothetical protein
MKKASFYSFLTALIMLSSSFGYAQYSATIASGRPGNANGAGTVGRGILQFQAGIQFAGYSDESGLSYSEFSENIVIRYGLTELFEISAVINQANGKYDFSVANSEGLAISGFNTTMLRARLKVIDNLAVQIGLNVPLLRNDFNNDYASPQIKVMYNTNFSDKISFTTNLGAQWGEIENDPNGFYVFSFSAGLPSQFSLLLEAYGDFSIYGLQHFYDAGLGYLVNPNLLLDINAGWGNNFNVESYFVTAGVSYRLKVGNRDQ